MNAESWLTGRRGQALAVAVGLVVLAIIWLGAIDPVRTWFDERQATLEQRQTLLHHMQDLVASLPALRATSSDRRADAPAPDGAAAAGALPGATDAVAAADLQERVQTMATAAGANLTAVETLPATAAGGWHKVALRISLNASWPVLMELVRAVERSPERIFIDHAQFHSPVVVTPPGSLPIPASMVLYGFRAAEPGTGT